MTAAPPTPRPNLDLPLRSRGMSALLTAQFLSALADNAALIAAIAILKAQDAASGIPLLQAVFVLPFLLLAPFVGQLADSWPKGRVMLWSNGVKLLGAALLAAGSNPFLAYGLIGIGATLYSPAKYGILVQLFAPARLVRANGWLEGSTIVAILLGVVLGGWLADHSLTAACAGLLVTYALAALANLAIPRVTAETPGESFAPLALLRHFGRNLRQLFSHPDSRFSLLGTSIFWGSGSTLRLALFAWVPLALGLADNQTPANLMGVVSVGIVLGAVVAGLWVRLENVNRALLGGFLLGPAILGLAWVANLPLAVLLLVAVGVGGGLFVVPLNALLQERGHETIGAGHALAVQNFAENAAMLLCVGAYSLTAGAGIPVTQVLTTFGLVLLLTVAGLALSRRRPGSASARGGEA